MLAVAALPALLCLALAYCYRNVLSLLVSQWWTNDVYSYGFLIPVISLYLVWQRRHLLAPARSGASPTLGMIVFLSGLGLLVLGRRVDIVAVQQLSFLPTLVGLVLIVAGSGTLRVVWFPAVYLLAMFPVWEVFTERLHYPFQQLSATMGASLLRLTGVPVLHQGTYLQLPNITLEVARVCSGVNYLIAVAAIGVPLGYTVFPDQLRRWVLVCFALCVAILANPLRVGLIGIFAYYEIDKNLHGPGHVFQGIFVAIVGYVALFGGARLLSSWRSSPASAAKAASRDEGAVPSPTARLMATRAGRVAAVTAAGLLVAIGTLPTSVFQVTLTGATASALPERIGTWRRVDGPAASVEGTPARGVSRLYRSSGGRSAEVYVGAVVGGSATDADRKWTALVDLGGSPLRLDLGNGESVTINRAVRSQGLEQRLILYWYDAGGRTYADSTPAKLFTLWHRATGLGRQSALVVVASPTNAASEEAASEALSDFARQLLPLLRRSSGD